MLANSDKLSSAVSSTVRDKFFYFETPRIQGYKLRTVSVLTK